jgi:MFS family permease
MTKDNTSQARIELILFFILISIVALGNGLSDSIYSNYFKEVYGVTAFQRGLIEFPRELPGILCTVAIGVLGFMGDIRVAFIAQILSLIGVTMLGLLTPSFGIMLVFLFINSMGMHLFMPLQDAIGMSLAEQDRIGRRMGQYSSVRAAFSLMAALMVFFGFRTGFFTFQEPVKIVFLISGALFTAAAVITALMSRRVNIEIKSQKRRKLVFRKQYKYFYFLTVLKGVQKQIAYVYGTWIIVDLLMKKADTIALLTIAFTFVSIFFLNKLGHWMDRYGIKSMMYFDALTFIIVYLVYGGMVWGIESGALQNQGWAVWTIYLLYIADRLSMQIGMVNSIYLRSIAVDKEEITSTLSMGVSLDHIISIIAAMIGGFIWTKWGSHWVFFLAALFSVGNLYVAAKVQPEKEAAAAELLRSKG